MLTPEQTQMKRKDSEIASLRQENARLEKKLKEIKSAIAEMARAFAEYMPHRRSELLTMARELEGE